MKFIITFIFCALCFTIGHADTTEETHNKVDAIKASISYPKYNVGDVLYVAFINDPKVGTSRHIPDHAINVLKVRIVDIQLVNTISLDDNNDFGLYINGGEPEWRYLFVDCSILNPRVKDFHNCYIPESRFAATREDTIKQLRETVQNALQ